MYANFHAVSPMCTKDASAPEQHPSVSDKTATAAAAATATAEVAVKTERKRAMGAKNSGRERNSGREVW